MLTWSVGTLLLALQVIAVICALYITFKAFQQSWKWGVFFFLTPLAYVGLSAYVGHAIAGVVIIAAQVYYISRPWHWKTLGRFYVYMVLCWAGISYFDIRRVGFLPEFMKSQPVMVVEQAGDTAVTGVEAFVAVEGGRIWYKRSGTGTGIPVILLHGGPGLGSFYLKPLEALGDDRPVVRYDQLGSGRSDKSRDTTLFTIAHFVEELDSLRSALGYERVHLVGHAWGSILGFEYYRKHPHRVVSLTLASASLSVPEWTRNTRRLIATLSSESREAIRTAELERDFDSPDYISAIDEYSDRYVSLRPFDEDNDSTTRTMGRAVHLHMWGPSAFTVTGSLRSYDATRLLRNVKVPALFTVGEADQAGVEIVRRLAGRTSGAKIEVIPDAAHIQTWDNTEVMLRAVREFLRGVEAEADAVETPTE